MQGFTLIEMLMAVFVFMILFLIASSFVNLAAGSTKSARTKILTNDVRSASDIISEKINNANQKVAVGTDTIYGLKVKNNILGIATTTGSGTRCTFFGENGDSLSMLEGSCPSSWPVASGLTKKLTGSSVKITGLTFTLANEVTPTSTTSPYLKIVVNAEDADAKYASDNQINLQTSYTIDYQTIKRLQAQ